MKKFIPFLLLSALISVMSAHADQLNGLVRNQGETLNFELSGQKNWDYDLKRFKEKNQTKVQLIVKASQKDLINQIKNTDNPHVQSVQVKPNGDGQIVVEFVLKNDKVETFDYLTDQPSKLVVDFYINENKSDIAVVEKKAEPVKSKPLPKKQASLPKKNSQRKEERKPAEADALKVEPGGIETSAMLKSGLTDGADSFFSRFVIKDVEISEKSILRSENNYYLRFPMLENEFHFWIAMKKNPPIYQFKTKNTSENKGAQLLKTLYDKKRWMVFKKTTEWFEEKFPNSEYNEVIMFMKADAYANLWQEMKNDKFYELAQYTYQQAIEKYPKSVLTERTSLLTGLLALDKKDYMTAIRRFTSHIDNGNYQGRTSTEYARLGLGFSYSKIKKLDEAIKEMDQVEKESRNELVKAEAAFRRGDFYFDAKKYDQAVENYNKAEKSYPKLAALFPNSPFNSMESNFWKRNYVDAHQSALVFAQKFPAHEFAPYALTRVGEVLDILGADQSKSVGSFLETYFRYGDSPKTIVARLHLLSTRMKGMKEEELKLTIAKMEELSSKSELVNIDQFKVTMIADGFTRRAEFDKAIEILSDFYQKNPNRPDARQVTKRIVRNIFDQMRNYSQNGRHREVLASNKKFADTWLKHENRIETDFMLGKAYESAGQYSVALQKYQAALNKMFLIKGTPQEKWVSVTEELPTEDSLQLKITKCYFENSDYQKSYEQLQKVKNPQLLTEEEQIERVYLASQLYERKGDIDTSIRYLTELVRVWNGKPELLVQSLLNLSELQKKKEDFEGAQSSLSKVFDIAEKTFNIEARDIIKAGRASAELYLKEGKADEAAKRYSYIVDRYENRYGLQEDRYKLGEIYFNKGEIKKAEKTWSSIKGQNSEIWSKLAQNKLRESRWSEDYNKYLKRIPAMSQVEGK